MTRADPRADEIHDSLRAGFGEASPKASGYLSGYSFRREREMVLEAVGAGPGTVVDLACGAGLVTLPLVRAGHRVIGGSDRIELRRRVSQAGRGMTRPGHGLGYGLQAVSGDTLPCRASCCIGPCPPRSSARRARCERMHRCRPAPPCECGGPGGNHRLVLAGT